MSHMKPDKITDLQTKCLIEIFKYLDYEDLYNLKQSHVAFDDAIEYTVRNGKFKFTIPSFDKDEDYLEKFVKIKNFIQLFGTQIKYLNVISADGWVDVPRIIIKFRKQLTTLIKNYCSGGNVKHCSFEELPVSMRFVNQNLPLFKSLESLRFKFAIEHSDFEEFIKFATQLELNRFEMTLMRCDMRFNFFETIAASKFETCIVRILNNDDMDDNDMDDDDDFSDEDDDEEDDDGDHSRRMRKPKVTNAPISTNLTIKYLDLGYFIYDPAVLVHFPNIEVLKYLEFSCKSLQPILLLTKLKNLELRYSIECFDRMTSFLKKLSKENRLESLTLDDSYVHYRRGDEEYEDYTHVAKKFVVILSKMTNLRELNVETIFKLTSQFLPQIAKNLKNLQRFRLEPSRDDDDDIYDYDIVAIKSKVLEFVAEARNLIQFEFGFDLKTNIQRFYNDLVDIRRTQQSDKLLYIKIKHGERISSSDEQSKYAKILKYKGNFSQTYQNSKS